MKVNLQANDYYLLKFPRVTLQRGQFVISENTHDDYPFILLDPNIKRVNTPPVSYVNRMF